MKLKRECESETEIYFVRVSESSSIKSLSTFPNVIHNTYCMKSAQEHTYRFFSFPSCSLPSSGLWPPFSLCVRGFTSIWLLGCSLNFQLDKISASNTHANNIHPGMLWDEWRWRSRRAYTHFYLYFFTSTFREVIELLTFILLALSVPFTVY